METKLGLGYFLFFPVQVELCVDCHRTVMLVTWKLVALSTCEECLRVDAFDVRASMLLSRASFAAFQSIESTGTTIDTAFTKKVFLKLHI